MCRASGLSISEWCIWYSDTSTFLHHPIRTWISPVTSPKFDSKLSILDLPHSRLHDINTLNYWHLQGEHQVYRENIMPFARELWRTIILWLEHALTTFTFDRTLQWIRGLGKSNFSIQYYPISNNKKEWSHCRISDSLWRSSVKFSAANSYVTRCHIQYSFETGKWLNVDFYTLILPNGMEIFHIHE